MTTVFRLPTGADEDHFELLTSLTGVIGAKPGALTVELGGPCTLAPSRASCYLELLHRYAEHGGRLTTVAVTPLAGTAATIWLTGDLRRVAPGVHILFEASPRDREPAAGHLLDFAVENPVAAAERLHHQKQLAYVSQFVPKEDLDRPLADSDLLQLLLIGPLASYLEPRAEAKIAPLASTPVRTK